MELLTFLLLAIFLFVAYITGGGDFLSPWFLLCGMFFATFLIVLLNFNNWAVAINGRFLLYILTAIISFGLGGLLIKRIQPKRTVKSHGDNRISVEDANIKKRYPAKIFLLISLIFTALYVLKLLLDNPGGSSFSGRIRGIYENIVNNNYTPGFLFNQMREVVTAIAYVNTYRLMVKLYSKKDRISFITLILPIITFIIMILITSDRNIFLRYAIYFLCVYILFFRENCKKKNVNAKLLKRIIIIGIICVLIFFILGKMKQYTSNFVRAVSIYGGSGIYNFNLWIKDFNGSNLFGEATFSTLNNSLKTIFSYIGIDLNIETLNRFDVLIEYQSPNGYVYSSNIYSSLKPFVEDFGYFGVILFPFIEGVFFQWLYQKAKRNKYGFSWVVYSMLIYPIVFFPILDQLFGRFTLGFIYELLWLLIIYRIAFGYRKIRYFRMHLTVRSLR